MAARLSYVLLNIVAPPSLYIEGGYNHRESLFGPLAPPLLELNRSAVLQWDLFYAGGTFCNNENETLSLISDSQPPQPFILMVDRGDCTFVRKVRNAQNVGAEAVVIADTTCLCSDTECMEQQNYNSAEIECAGNKSCSSLRCQTTVPILGDDGSGSDITIPSYLMFTTDANRVKNEIRSSDGDTVTMEIANNIRAATVEYEMWSTPLGSIVNNVAFLESVKAIAVALDNRVTFTPGQFIYDGTRSHCINEDTEKNFCYNLCTNSGRYCAMDPDNDPEEGITGADVVAESLRRLCIWQLYGQDGIGVRWWDYVIGFARSCSRPAQFGIDVCLESVYTEANVTAAAIEQCMSDSGGLIDNGANSLLDEQLRLQEERGLVFVPTVFVNGAAIRFLDSNGPTTTGIFQAICGSYRTSFEPSVCEACAQCTGFTTECLTTGICQPLTVAPTIAPSMDASPTRSAAPTFFTDQPSMQNDTGDTRAPSVAQLTDPAPSSLLTESPVNNASSNITTNPTLAPTRAPTWSSLGLIDFNNTVCENALVAFVDTSRNQGSIQLATNSSNTLQPSCGARKGRWYSFVGTGARLRVSICHSVRTDSALAIYTGIACNAISLRAWIANGLQSGVSRNACRDGSTLSVDTAVGAQFFVLVTTMSDESGVFDLRVSTEIASTSEAPQMTSTIMWGGILFVGVLLFLV